MLKLFAEADDSLNVEGEGKAERWWTTGRQTAFWWAYFAFGFVIILNLNIVAKAPAC